jgi:hypothetical protein
MSAEIVRALVAAMATKVFRPSPWRLGLVTLGRCPRCMRQAFACAVLAWGVAGLSLLAWPAAATACVLMAVVLTALWAAHVCARAIAYSKCAGCEATGTVNAARRRALPEIAQLLTVAALAGIPGLARAQSCTCSCGGTNWSPGAIACMGGFRYVCNARTGTGQCGWDPLGGPNNRCDGGEHCR